MKAVISEDLRSQVFKRDGHTCRYCGTKQGPFHADHVYPESKGGETTVNNLATACEPCNHKKHTKVGMWPKPIGYFSDRKIIALNASFSARQYAALIFVSLLFSGLMLFISISFMNSREFIVMNAVVFGWFMISVYHAVRWVWFFLTDKMEN